MSELVMGFVATAELEHTKATDVPELPVEDQEEDE